jgi:hypothetical protein
MFYKTKRVIGLLLVFKIFSYVNGCIAIFINIKLQNKYALEFVPETRKTEQLVHDKNLYFKIDGTKK